MVPAAWMIGGCHCVGRVCHSGPVTFSPGHAPYQRPVIRKRGLSGAVIAAIALATAVVALCATGLAIAVLRNDDPGTEAKPVPAYRVVSEKEYQATVEVDSALASPGYELIVNHIRAKQRKGAAYNVYIDCSTGARINSSNRITANGLAHAAPDLTVYPDRRCPNPLPPVLPWLPQDAETAYLQELSRIDAGLTVSDSRAIGRASDTCLDITTGEITGDKLAERVVERLSGGNATIDKQQAEKAIALMRKHVCAHFDKWWAARVTASPAG